ncbi:MAG: multicopper oxidase domain-containing protein [Trebonia sp.]
MMPVISVALALGLIVGLIGLKLFRPESNIVSTVAASTTGQQAAAAKPVTLNFTEGDMYIKPSTVTVPAGADVTVHVTNQGPSQHTLALEGRSTPMIPSGQSLTEHWGVLTHSVQAWCLVPGHKEAGMLVNVNVTGAAPAATAGSSTASGTTTAANSNDAKIDSSATPPKGWQPRTPDLPPVSSGTVHHVTFVITQHNIQVAPGVTQQRWTYSGTAPGPILHGKVGDTFDVRLVNKGTMPHSLDFHASQVAPNVDMRTIKPGQSLDYKFVAKKAGIFAYHCDADPMIYHISNGMYGAVVIDPPNLDHVDAQFVFVQSELYLGPQGQPGDEAKMLADQPDGVVFNGYYNQYAFAPIKVKPGERVRVWLENDGPNEPADFHVVGTIFDTAFKEGQYLLKPNSGNGGSQLLDLQPFQGGFVEFTVPAAGKYPFINHKMADMARGALGFFVAA